MIHRLCSTLYLIAGAFGLTIYRFHELPETLQASLNILDDFIGKNIRISS